VTVAIVRYVYRPILHVIVSILLVLLFVSLSVHLCTLLPYLVNKDVYNTSDIEQSGKQELNPVQVDSAFYRPWDGKMSTSQRAVMFCGWGVKAGIV